MGGVFIAGGIAPRYIDLLRKSDFRARFLAKGRFADYNTNIGTFVITHDDPGLLGAALCLGDKPVNEFRVLRIFRQRARDSRNRNPKIGARCASG
jgi:hypothetical protein